MRRIYIATSWKNKTNVRSLAEALRANGHEAFDFTDLNNRPNELDKFVFGVKEWLKYSGQQPHEIDWIDFLSWPPTKRAFASDKAGLDWADTVILLHPCGRSAHLEGGYGVGAGKELFLYGDLPIGEFDAMYGFAKQCFRFNELGDLLDALDIIQDTEMLNCYHCKGDFPKSEFNLDCQSDDIAMWIHKRCCRSSMEMKVKE